MLGIVPFVYSLPIALIVAELSSAFPEDGGYVVWVRRRAGKAPWAATMRIGYG